MKRIIYFIILCPFLLLGCDKNNSDVDVKTDGALRVYLKNEVQLLNPNIYDISNSTTPVAYLKIHGPSRSAFIDNLNPGNYSIRIGGGGDFSRFGFQIKSNKLTVVTIYHYGQAVAEYEDYTY